MLCELLGQLPEKLDMFAPCHPAPVREAWEGLPPEVRARLRAAGRAEAAKPIAPLPLSLWLDFIRTGCRARWEEAYFSRRARLAALVMAECCDYTGEYLDAIADTIWAICEESAWQLPAHNNYVRDAPQLPLPDTARPVVDLFAAETGALLSVTAFLLFRDLEEKMPGLCTRIIREVDGRIRNPYLHDHFWWMGSGDTPLCNWTSWCTQNVLLCFFTLPGASQDELHAAARQAAYSLDCFLKDYGPDGCCNEGAQYYRHAGLTLWGALHILSSVAPGVFGWKVFGNQKIRNIAEYIMNVHVEGPYYLNFGDCSPLAGRCGAREYRFAKAVGSKALAELAAADFAADPDPDRLTAQDASSRINLWYRLLTVFTEAELRGYAAPSASPGDAWYPSVGLRVCRRSPYTVGIKAGGNGDSHNHNDTGSVTLYKDGRPLLIDVGVESYTQKTFSPQRYEIWTMQSAWHNLPTFDPEGAALQQLPGAAYAAREVSLLENGLAMDIAPAYGEAPGLGYYRRSALLSADGLSLTDETDYPGLVALSLMSAEAPAPSGAGVRLGELGEIRLAAPAVRIETETVPIGDPRLRTAWPDRLYRTRIYFTGRMELSIL